MENAIIKNLRSFNRKERFYLIGMALGNENFSLHPRFRKELKNVFGLDVPKDAFVAMDYHLDWIHASLSLITQGVKDVYFNRDEELLKGNQEDIDLLVGWGDRGATHLIFLEAKGVTSFLPKQLDSKVKRLSRQFRQDFKGHNVVPHFALVSPKRPNAAEIPFDKWPDWMKKGKRDFYWIPLTCLRNVLRKPGLKYVVRCNSDQSESKSGKCWKVKREMPVDEELVI